MVNCEELKAGGRRIPAQSGNVEKKIRRIIELRFFFAQSLHPEIMSNTFPASVPSRCTFFFQTFFFTLLLASFREADRDQLSRSSHQRNGSCRIVFAFNSPNSPTISYTDNSFLLDVFSNFGTRICNSRMQISIFFSLVRSFLLFSLSLCPRSIRISSNSFVFYL